MQQPTIPELSVTAIGSGRQFDRGWIDGRPLLLLFHDQHGEPVVRALQTTLRARWPDARDVVAASVVNMAAIPFFLRSLAATVIESAYRSGAEQIPAGLDPADYVVILPDWKGELFKHFGVQGSGRSPVAVLIDGNWQAVGRFEGNLLVEEAMAALAHLKGESGG